MSQPAPARFPRLDELRFLAAFAVVVVHVEQLKLLHGCGNCYAALYPLRMAVTFFFVLSGFLITHLLLAERAAAGTVAVRRFYLRRALRIWPLYYLIVLTGLVVVPWVDALHLPQLSPLVAANWTEKAALFLLLLPNVAVVLYPAVPYAAQTWSIGVEEQFYLVWPLIFRFARRPLVWMLATGAAVAVARVLAERHLGYCPATALLRCLQVDCMAVGGVAAHVLFHRRRTALAVVYHPVTQAAALAGLAALAFGKVEVPDVELLVYAGLFAVVVVNAASNPATLFRVGSAWLARPGQWSYGIYMYHPLAIGVGIWLLGRQLGLDLGNVAAGLLLHAVTLAVTLGVSFLSYRYFEKPILDLSRRASVPPVRVAAGPELGRAKAA